MRHTDNDWKHFCSCYHVIISIKRNTDLEGARYGSLREKPADIMAKWCLTQVFSVDLPRCAPAGHYLQTDGSGCSLDASHSLRGHIVGTEDPVPSLTHTHTCASSSCTWILLQITVICLFMIHKALSSSLGGFFECLCLMHFTFLYYTCVFGRYV